MRKINSFRKCCPVCHSISISKTMRKCQYCGCILIDIENKDCKTSYDGSTGTFKFEVFAKIAQKENEK